ncbi:hypothetical protein [Aeromonas dhakensis]|uniref:hypothetical protein n=1 Tax=Aeromonas dhakensis TaxID=196024 RepID=UPI0038D1663C
MNLELPPEILTFCASAVFAAGGFYSWLKSRSEDSKAADESQSESITEIFKRIEKLEIRNVQHEQLISHFDLRLKEQGEAIKEFTRSVNALERLVARLEGVISKGN